MSDTGFGALGVSAELCTRLAQSGLVEPFPIQTAVIPVALAGRDVVGRGPTGSGKTMAFGIPVIANLRPGRKRRPTGLVLAPTRELAEQIAVALRPLARVRGLDVVSIYGGVGYQSQRRALDAGRVARRRLPGPLGGPRVDGRARTSATFAMWSSTRPTASPTWGSYRPCAGSSTPRTPGVRC